MLHCDAACSVTVVNSTNVIMTKILLGGWWQITNPVSLLKIMNCYHVSLLNIGTTILSLTNAFGDSVISSIRTAVLQIIYSDEISRMMNHTLVIQDYRPPTNMAIITSEALVVVKLLLDTYVVNIRVTNTDFERMYLSIENLPTLLLIESKHCGKYTNTITTQL